MNTILQIRLSVPDFANGVSFIDPVIIERADNVSLIKTVNSSDESISFNVPPNDPKMQYVTYTRWWECWDTVTNTRLNYGPIKDISGKGGTPKTVTGPGRSATLGEFYKSTQTFYTPVNTFFDDLRYENIAAEPRTSTIINTNTDSDYYGLSKRSKDYAIDEQTGWISIGRDTPVKGTIKSSEFWSGTGKADYLTIDLGQPYTIARSSIVLPWWAGATINNSRTYDWEYLYSNDNSSFTSIYQTDIPNYHGAVAPGGFGLYFGETPISDFSDAFINTIPVSNRGYDLEPNPIEARYWKINITNTHGWVGNIFAGGVSEGWDWECGGSNIFNGETVQSPTISGGIIPKNELSPASDCHASVLEVGIYRKIIGRDSIPNLLYHQIQDDNRQITYYHVPTSEEMLVAGGGKKFEPGTFFRNVSFTATNTTVKDEFNALLHSGGSAHIKCPAYSRLVLFSDPTTQVTYVDTWPGKVDAFSYGGSYAYTTVDRDYAVLHFRGVSLKWFATIPEGVTAGEVSIELRSKDDSTGAWSSWDVLEDSFTLPVGVSANKVWEISFESGILLEKTVYELRITNLNGGYVSIDAFAGYWSGSFTEYNQDDARVAIRRPEKQLTVYGGTYSFGSVEELLGPSSQQTGISFVGDRVIVYSRKGKNFGTVKLALFGNPNKGYGDPAFIIPIPGGIADGSLLVDLNSSYEIAQAVIFDSNEFFQDENALPWKSYTLGLYLTRTDPDAIWVDGFGVHETSGVSVKFLNTSHLDILKNTCEALQLEWDITESGLYITPRIGIDTDVIIAEGFGTTIDIEYVEDASNIATMLITSGADIDGLPLSAVVENKVSRKLFGRTIQRLNDFRNVSDYFTLIGASRAELLKRREPDKKITINLVGTLPVSIGDSFITKKSDLELRVRLITLTRNQSSSSGTDYSLECIRWPEIE